MPIQKKNPKISPLSDFSGAQETNRFVDSGHLSMTEGKIVQQLVQRFSHAQNSAEQEQILREHISSVIPCQKAGIYLANEGLVAPLETDSALGTSLTATTESNSIQSFVKQYLGDEEVPEQTSLMIAPLYTSRGYLGFLYVLDYPRARGYIQSDLNYLEGTSTVLAPLIEGNACRLTLTEQKNKQVYLDQILRQWQSIRSLSAISPQLLTQLKTICPLDTVAYFVLQEDQVNIRCHFSEGLYQEKLQAYEAPLGESFLSRAIVQEKTVCLSDPRLLKQILGIGVSPQAEVLLLPVWQQDKVGAVLLLARWQERFPVGTASLFPQIAAALGQYQEEEELRDFYEQAYDTTLEALAAMTERREREPIGHSRRVVRYVERLAQEMGISEQEIKILKRGALLHDAGKIGIADTILWKPDWLSIEERQVMEQHTRYGFEMLRNIPHLQGALQIILMHHERWDGLGYPLGLTKENIPFPARLFAVADAFDAITSPRAYRPARDFEEGRRIIAMEAGKQFDPTVVEAFLHIPASHWKSLQEKQQGENTSPDLPAAYASSPATPLEFPTHTETEEVSLPYIEIVKPIEPVAFITPIPTLEILDLESQKREEEDPLKDYLEAEEPTGDHVGDELMPLPLVKLVA